MTARAGTGDADRPAQVDFDLHGFVGVRLLEPLPRDVAAVARQLGPLQSPLSRTPDITVASSTGSPTAAP